METSLHRQLKEHYAGATGLIEARVGRYRIDVRHADQLVEIQHGGLSSIRDKVRQLLGDETVLVVKPLVISRRIVMHQRRGGRVLRERLSPKRGMPWDLFHELVHFTGVFPHPRLTIEVLPVEIEEHRHPGHGRRRRWRHNDFEVADQILLSLGEPLRLCASRDLRRLLPAEPRSPFHTGQLAESVGVDRWVAQRIAYCLRQCGAARAVGKAGGAHLYEWCQSRPARRAA